MTTENKNAPAVQQAEAGAITTAPQKTLTIRDRLEGDAFKQAVAKALPAHLKPDRFIRVALTAMTRTPKLAQCDQASFFQCLLTLSQYGLEPDGRRAHLIPFENRKRGVTECQLIIDWKGLSELVYRSGLVSTLHADVVREGDIFNYSMGTLKEHVPHFLRRDHGKPEKAGDVMAAYATATMRDGTGSKTEVMSREQIEGIRGRSRAGQSGPWTTDWDEMAKKTAFRRLSKWLPLSSELHEAVEADDDAVDIQTSVVARAEPLNPFQLPDSAPDVEEQK
jgi:recombination protein RecT